MPIHNRKKVLSWAFYDWANSAFATTVMAGFFPIFFKQYWSAGVDVSESSFKLGVANSIASVIIAILAPFLGAIADQGGIKRRFLFLFALLGVVMTGGLFLVAQGQWAMAIFVYVMATIGFSGSIIFNDAQLVDVTDESRYHPVSALGYSFGYLGGGLLFALNVTMTLKPEWFGLANAAQAVKVSFLTVALWWAVFSIPVMLFVKDPPHDKASYAIRKGLRQLIETAAKVKKLKYAFIFLCAYWLYIDGVGTVIRMAVDYGMSIGFESSQLIQALLITQFVGFPAAIAFGKIGQKFGPKTGIYIALVIYTSVTVYAYFMTKALDFYVLAVCIGLVQGGIQSLSRSLFAELIPQQQATEYFGFFNMAGKFAAVLGPFVVGSMNKLTGDPRVSILSLIPFFVIGGTILYFVDIKEGRLAAKEL